VNILSNFFSALLNRTFFAVCFILFTIQVNAADNFPEKATKLVTDYTGTLRPDELQSLENKLVTFDDSTSVQIAVVMMTSVGDYDISDYAVQLFNKWKIGNKSNNSGVLLLVAKEDRKVWITTGYGMEGVFPDALVKQVIDREIVPKFRSGDYFGGIDAGTKAITGIVKGEYKATAKTSKGGKGKLFPFLMMLFISCPPSMGAASGAVPFSAAGAGAESCPFTGISNLMGIPPVFPVKFGFCSEPDWFWLSSIIFYFCFLFVFSIFFFLF
jgi:uncharacterized protein